MAITVPLTGKTHRTNFLTKPHDKRTVQFPIASRSNSILRKNDGQKDLVEQVCLSDKQYLSDTVSKGNFEVSE
jgi:hypothetical protein